MKMSEQIAIAEEASWPDLQPILDEELHRLPAKYRVPIVLCYLKGKTEQETAHLLGCPMGTVSWRLVRARALLRNRLTRRGLARSTAGLGALLVDHAAQATVPAPLVDLTLSVAQGMLAAGKTTAAGVGSAKVAALTEGVLRTMWLTKLKSIAATIFLALLLVGS